MKKEWEQHEGTAAASSRSDTEEEPPTNSHQSQVLVSARSGAPHMNAPMGGAGDVPPPQKAPEQQLKQAEPGSQTSDSSLHLQSGPRFGLTLPLFAKGQLGPLDGFLFSFHPLCTPLKFPHRPSASGSETRMSPSCHMQCGNVSSYFPPHSTKGGGGLRNEEVGGASGVRQSHSRLRGPAAAWRSRSARTSSFPTAAGGQHHITVLGNSSSCPLPLASKCTGTHPSPDSFRWPR